MPSLGRKMSERKVRQPTDEEPSSPEGEAAESSRAGGRGEHVLTEADLAEHIPIIRNYLRKIVRREEIEDAVQTVLARALENLERYRGDSSPRVWLLGIARNVGYEQARSRQRAPLLASKEQEDVNVEAGISGAPEPTTEEVLGRKQQQALVLSTLHELSLDEQLPLLLTYIDGVPGPEAAETLGVSFAAFRQRLSRARQAMAKHLERRMKDGESFDAAQILEAWRPVLDPHGRSKQIASKRRPRTRGASRSK